MLHKTKPAGAATPPTGYSNCTPPIVPARPGIASPSRLSYELRQAINEAAALAVERAELRRLIERLEQSTKERDHGF